MGGDDIIHFQHIHHGSADGLRSFCCDRFPSSAKDSDFRRSLFSGRFIHDSFDTFFVGINHFFGFVCFTIEFTHEFQKRHIVMDAVVLDKDVGDLARFQKRLELAVLRLFPDDEVWLHADQRFHIDILHMPNGGEGFCLFRDRARGLRARDGGASDCIGHIDEWRRQCDNARRSGLHADGLVFIGVREGGGGSRLTAAAAGRKGEAEGSRCDRCKNFFHKKTPWR